MDPVTHVTTGVVLSQLLPAPSRGWAALAGILFALLPDVDYFLLAVDRLSFIRHHRGFTHSLLAVPLFALLGAGVGRALGGPRWFRPLFFLGLAVLASHLFLDLATSFGTQIFSPLSRRKAALDWVFIIDPYLTLFVATGAAAAWFLPAWGRQVGAVCLAAAGAYMLLCGLYHHQALALARQVFHHGAAEKNPGAPSGSKGLGRGWQLFPEKSGAIKVAAFPQPFSCRRWHLIASGPQGIRQTFVELPYLAPMGMTPEVKRAQAITIPPGRDCRAPGGAYHPPQELVMQSLNGVLPDLRKFPPEARRILEEYLEFARFPLLYRAKPLGEGQVLEWLDLRFSVPGRTFPFVLRLHLDGGGRLQNWLLGRCQVGEN